MQYVSLGRAFGSHPRGRGFESLQVHQNKKVIRKDGFFILLWTEGFEVYALKG